MLEVIMAPPASNTISIEDVNYHRTPIFVKKEGKIIGMLVDHDRHGWIIATGGSYGMTGYHVTAVECLKSVSNIEGITLHVESE